MFGVVSVLYLRVGSSDYDRISCYARICGYARSSRSAGISCYVCLCTFNCSANLIF